MSSKRKSRREERRRSLKRLLALLFHYGWRLKGRILLLLLLSLLLAATTKAPFLLIGQIVEKVVYEEEPRQAGEKEPVPAAKEEAGIDLLNRLERKVLGWVGVEERESQDGIARRRNTLLAVGIIAIALALGCGICMFFFVKLSHYLALRVVVDLRVDLCSHLLTLGLVFFSRRKLGDLISRVANDTSVTQSTFRLVFENMFIEPLLLLVSMVIVAWMLQSLAMALALFFCIPLLGFPIYKLGRKVRKGSRKSLASMADATEAMSQMFGGIRTVQAFQAESREQERFRAVNEDFIDKTMIMIRARAASRGVTNFLYQALFAALICGVGWYSVDPESRFMEKGRLAVLLAIMVSAYTHIKRLVRSYGLVMESLGAVERIGEYLDEKPHLPVKAGVAKLGRLQGAVEMRQVSFAYDSEKVLKDINFRCEAGKTLALVGPSGAGKSTLMDLVARFYDPTTGQVLVDGIDLAETDPQDYRSQVALVSQDPFLFNTTIGENILYGRPKASREEVEEAARAAQIHDFIRTLPQGYETVVGERGTRLSGGQMQRITIARAILKRASIMLLDEATSSLDSASEKEVQRALANLMAGKTCFVIAHRLSTVRNADWILALEEGVLVEQGTHEDLLAAGGLYKHLHDLQFQK